jgi:hypothetical protein
MSDDNDDRQDAEAEAYFRDKTLCPVHSRALDDLLQGGSFGGSADPLSKTSGQA